MSTASNESAVSAEDFIPLSEPYLQGNESRYVQECLDSGWVSSVGSFVNRFEDKVARVAGTAHGIATVNGTSALHTALLAVGVQPDDEVLVSTLTFIASANAIRYAGAHPVLIDAEPNYWQMDTDLVSEFLSTRCHCVDGVLRNRQTGRRIAALMPVHILGHAAAIDEICQLARLYDLPIVEDAAESLGTKYREKPIGSFGNITCFSFNGNKTVTAGAGGMIVTDDAKLAERARYLTTQAKDDPIEYVHHEVGYNYRLSNVLAALGLAQLEQLDRVVAKKRAIAATYQQHLSHPGLHWFREAEACHCTYWLSTVLIDPLASTADATTLRDRLQEQGIQSRRLWRPIHTNQPFAHCESMITGVADRIADHALSLPSSASLTEQQQQRVCHAVEVLLNA